MKGISISDWVINVIVFVVFSQSVTVVLLVVALILKRWHPDADERFWFGPYCGLVFVIDLCTAIAIASDRSEETKNLGGKLDNIAEKLDTIQFLLNERAQKPR